jgi:LPXTG-motif cell wall-anchored protein
MDIGWTQAKNTNLPNEDYWYGANCYDINDDGALDIVGASWGAGVKVWLNNINHNIDDKLEQFNLRITDEDITLSQESPINGDEVTIYATVVNVGDWDASEFTVKFFIDDDLIDTQVDFNFLEANDDIQLEKTWTATEGEHMILVEIEVLNTDLESDSTDNSAEIKINVEENDHGGESNNNTNSSTSEQSTLIFILIIIIVVVLLVIFFVRRKSKNTKFIVVEPIEETEDDN